MAHLPETTFLHENELFQEFRGAITENFVAQELAHSRYLLFYWTSEGRAEVDFVLEQEGKIYPLEVKSGSSSKKRSLIVYADTYRPQMLIRCSPMNLKKDGDVLNCPLYFMEGLRSLIDRF
jgi:predicted AAA+ superfamily ATPase